MHHMNVPSWPFDGGWPPVPRRKWLMRSLARRRFAKNSAPWVTRRCRSCARIERVLQRHNLTSPRFRLTRGLPALYPGPQAHDTNQVHQVDLVGPRYLTGSKTKYYFYVCKDAFDQAVYAEFHAGNDMAQVLAFLIHAWQRLGVPTGGSVR